MFCTTSRLSHSARSWYTTSIPRRPASFGPWILTSRPSKRISPLSGECVPAMHLISVDLPAPLSPTSAITSLGRTSKSTSVSACTDPNDFVIPRSSRRGVASLSVTVASFLPHRRWGRLVGVPTCDRSTYLQYCLYAPTQTWLLFRNPSVKSRL